MYSFGIKGAWVRGVVMVDASVQSTIEYHTTSSGYGHANKSPARPAINDLLLAVAMTCTTANHLTFKSPSGSASLTQTDTSGWYPRTTDPIPPV